MIRTMVFLLCAYADAVTLWTHRKFRKTNLHVLSFKFRVSGMYIASIVALLLDPGYILDTYYILDMLHVHVIMCLRTSTRYASLTNNKTLSKIFVRVPHTVTRYPNATAVISPERPLRLSNL
jgi:hypothetical protein